MKRTLTLLFGLAAVTGFGQVTNKGVPYSWRASNLNEPQKILLPAVDVKTLLEEDKRNENNKNVPYRFGYEFTTNYTLQNSGSWNTLPNGDRLWRGHFNAPGAKAMHFWFKDFYIPKGATLYVYNNTHTELIGAYNHNQNSGTYFGTWPVSGDNVWLEYYEPKEQQGNSKLTICKIGHAYKTLRGMANTNKEVFSESCHYDVECVVDAVENRKNITKHSVTRIIGSKPDGGAFLASGALINNTANNGIPYVLSANHAWVDGTMYTFRFNWINPTPDCPSSGNGDSSINEVQTMSGAVLRARREESDFMLLELINDIPDEWGTILSGWSRVPEAAAFSYGVHHPAGDIMKVSLDLDPPTLADNGYVWSVGDWEIGAVEGGSSGSPLLNPEGEIIGQLWYGMPGCNGNQPNGGLAGYGRFSKSWDDGDSPATRLMEWLDPQNTGSLILEPYPAQTIYANDVKLALIDLGHDGCSQNISPQVRLINYGSSTLTAATINYLLNTGETQTINWEGTLPENQTTLIDIPALTGVIGENTFTAWVSAPNNTNDDNPGNNEVTANFKAHTEINATELTLTINTDEYGEEVSWELRNQYGILLYSVPGETYEGFQTYTTTLMVPDDGCYAFTINDAYGDGICCDYGQGSYSLVSENGTALAQGGAYAHTETTNFKISHALSTQNPALKGVAVYPNPSAGIYNISGTKNGDTYAVYNLLGQEINRGVCAQGSTTAIDISGSAMGVYILKIKSSNSENSYKLIKD
ncbi:T9SS type A sorting domain-containing protein [Flavobacterium sp. RHBU_3]|uniref:T9SS type A sorting domain-containing protein n=1 Tax=Flavobacterium sp. RHBU_3 TaxID=3391184 RepID=UPI003984B6CB